MDMISTGNVIFLDKSEYGIWVKYDQLFIVIGALYNRIFGRGYGEEGVVCGRFMVEIF